MIRLHSIRQTRILMALTLTLGAASCGSDSSGPDDPDIATTTFAPSLGVDLSARTVTGTGLYWRDLTVGSGTTATIGRQVGVIYTGWLVNGTQFDSNVGRALLSFRVGLGEVVPGFDEGVRGMAVGGERQLIIPPSLGYGRGGRGPVSPKTIFVLPGPMGSAQ